MARFCHHLEEELGGVVQAIAILSPPNAEPGDPRQAFRAHSDQQEQFILQISGTRRWRIYDAPFRHPLTDQESSKMGLEPGECREEVILEPGDGLYVPRGTFHEAVTLREHSLHVIVEIIVFRWLDALKAALQSLSADARFRASVPLRALAEQNKEAFSEAFERAKALALEEMSATAAVAGMRQAFRELCHPVLEGELLACVAADDDRAAAGEASP